MKNSFGNNITVTIFGESHGEYIGAVLDGIPSGIAVDTDFIKKQLDKRRPHGTISTSRAEEDNFKIISGLNGGITCGTPLCILVENSNIRSKDYENTILKPRPSHADYSLFCKYGQEGILPGGGHSSGRITVALVAVGAIALSVLKSKGIFIGTHIKQIGDIKDREFADLTSDIDNLNDMKFAVLDEKAKEKMMEKINSAKSQNDSIGGVLETVISGLPAGVGEPWFDSLEGVISHAVFSVPGVKGIEFGAGFSVGLMQGSEANDEFFYENGEVRTKTNNSGGILGGISNGQPVVFRTALKPTPTISKEQDTVDLKEKINAKLLATGRHDPCIVHRARVVTDSVTALAVLDMLCEKYGRDGLK